MRIRYGAKNILNGKQWAECNCYVQHLTEEERFTLRYGAHEIECLVYRESLDPVDKLKDEDARNYFLLGRRPEDAPPVIVLHFVKGLSETGFTSDNTLGCTGNGIVFASFAVDYSTGQQDSICSLCGTAIDMGWICLGWESKYSGEEYCHKHIQFCKNSTGCTDCECEMGFSDTGDLLAQWKYKLLQVHVLEAAIDKAMLDTDSWATPWYKLPEWEQLVKQRKVLTRLAELLTSYQLEQASDYYQNNQ
jgi:hypothetical protein